MMIFQVLILLYIVQILPVKASNKTFLDSANYRNLRASATSSCTCSFHEYHACPLEQKWTMNVRKWQDDACEFMPVEDMNSWLSAVSDITNGTMDSISFSDSPIPSFSLWRNSLSAFTYVRGNCDDGRGKYLHIPIEPTAGIARDPRKCLEPMTEKFTQSKEFLLPLSLRAAACAAMPSISHVSGAHHSLRQRKTQAFLFDAGASVAASGYSKNHVYAASGTTGWIDKWYRDRGIIFDRIYAWEPTVTTDKYLTGADVDFVSRVHFFPTGVTDEVGAATNPLSIIKSICRPADFVAFKLDIDCKRKCWDIQMGIVTQILTDPKLPNLIDEFYFEHHFKNKAMRLHQGSSSEAGIRGVDDLESWFDMVTSARARGIRFHYWP